MAGREGENKLRNFLKSSSNYAPGGEMSFFKKANKMAIIACPIRVGKIYFFKVLQNVHQNQGGISFCQLWLFEDYVFFGGGGLVSFQARKKKSSNTQKIMDPPAQAGFLLGVGEFFLTTLPENTLQNSKKFTTSEPSHVANTALHVQITRTVITITRMTKNNNNCWTKKAKNDKKF